METLFQKSKMSHAVRVLKCSENDKKILNYSDLKKGFKLFMKSKNESNNKVDNYIKQSMYI